MFDLVPLSQIAKEMKLDPRTCLRQLQALSKSLGREIVIKVGNRNHVDRAYLHQVYGGAGQSFEERIATLEAEVAALRLEIAQRLG